MKKKILLLATILLFSINTNLFAQDSLNVFKTGEMYNHWNYINGMAVINDMLILGTGDCGIHIYDISNPEAPAKINSYCFHAAVDQIVVCGEYVVIHLIGPDNYFHYESSIAILDLSNPLDINILAYHKLEEWPWTEHNAIIKEAGGMIYYQESSGVLQQIDISDPLDIVVNEYPGFYEPFVNITVVNDKLVLVYQRKIEFYNPEEMTLINSCTLEDVSIGVNYIKDSKIYFISSWHLYSIEISNPSVIIPVFLQFENEEIQSLFVANDLLYQSYRTDTDWEYYATRVLDISDPSDIIERSYISLGFIGLSGIVSRGENEEYLFFAGADISFSQGEESISISRVSIYNMSNPSNPVYINSSIQQDFTGPLKNIYYYNDRLYYTKTVLPHYVGDVVYDQVIVTDVSDPTQPVELGHLGLNPYRVDLICFNQDVLYAFIRDEMGAVDLSDPTDPEELYTYDSAGLNHKHIEIFDNYLVSHDTSFVGIYLLNNPRQEPQFQGSFTMDNLPEKITRYEDYLIFIDRDRYLALDISDPESPTVAVDTEIELWMDTDKIVRHGSRLYISSEYHFTFSTYGIEVLDISDPLVPISDTEGRILTEYKVDDLYVEGDYLYFVNGYNGFHVYNINDPSDTVEAGYYCSGSIGKSIVVNDYTAYSVDERLCVYNCQQVLGVEEGGSTTPSEFSLLQAYPNPFNPTLNVHVALPETGDLRLSVHNILGQEVAVLVDRSINAGYHNFVFDGSDLSSGVYFVKASVDGKMNDVQKVVLMK